MKGLKSKLLFAWVSINNIRTCFYELNSNVLLSFLLISYFVKLDFLGPRTMH